MKLKNYRSFLSVIVVVSMVVFLLSAGSKEKAGGKTKPSEIRIGYLGLVNAQLLSKNLGLHEKEMDVPVKWVRFDSGRDVNTAMAGGSIDFGNVGLPPATIGVSQGMDYWAIMCSDVLGAVESLAAGDGINSVKDLEGKKVAAPFGSTTHYELLKALTMENVDISKVQILDMAPAEAVAAFMRGNIDAAYIWEPSLGEMVKAGAHIVLTSKQMADKGYLTWDVIAVQPKFAKAYPEYVVKFLKSELEAIDYWYDKKQSRAEIVSKELGGIDLKDTIRMTDGVELPRLDEQLSQKIMGTSKKKGNFAEDMVSVGEFLFDQGRISKPLTLEQAQNFLHPEFLEMLK